MASMKSNEPTPMYKIRFHLAQGPNFRMWQVKNPDGTVEYYDPDTTIIAMRDIRVRCQAGAAQKIHAGAKKSVCAWIEAVEVAISAKNAVPEIQNPSDDSELSFNPRVAPEWLLDGQPLIQDRFADGFTYGRKVFV